MLNHQTFLDAYDMTAIQFRFDRHRKYNNKKTDAAAKTESMLQRIDFLLTDFRKI